MNETALFLIALFILTVVGTWGTGCEGDNSDRLDAAPELRQEALACSRTITEAFGLPANDLRGVVLVWGERSSYEATGIITINKSLQGSALAIHCHMLDEVMHAVTGLDHDTRTLGGVEIKGVVSSW